MKTKSRSACLLRFVCIICICMSAVYALAIDMKEKAPVPAEQVSPQKTYPNIQLNQGYTRILKPDLVVERLNIEISPIGTGTIAWKAKVIVTVKNLGGSTSAHTLTTEGAARRSEGAFKVKLEWTDDRSGYIGLCDSGIAELARGASKDFFCEDTIPSMTFRRYRATADYMNWIDESNETNNEKTNSLLTPG
jgi:hypothetical protein